MSISSVCHIIMTACLSLFLFILVSPEGAGAVLSPEEILVVVNAESGESIRLGRIYVQLRHIPATHLLMVSPPMRDEITRWEYDDLIAAPLRKYMKTLQQKGDWIRCIVTTYGIPLRIGVQRPPGISEEEIKVTQAEVFAMSNPYLSWRMVLIGDPLYNPFKARPAFLLMDAPPPPG